MDAHTDEGHFYSPPPPTSGDKKLSDFEDDTYKVSWWRKQNSFSLYTNCVTDREKTIARVSELPAQLSMV